MNRRSSFAKYFAPPKTDEIISRPILRRNSQESRSAGKLTPTRIEILNKRVSWGKSRVLEYHQPDEKDKILKVACEYEQDLKSNSQEPSLQESPAPAAPLAEDIEMQEEKDFSFGDKETKCETGKQSMKTIAGKSTVIEESELIFQSDMQINKVSE